jgi:DNA-binding IclR family transcriptional regulator
MPLGTLDKCVRILAELGRGIPTRHVSELAELADLPRSTAYRYVSALRSLRLVEADDELGGYRLGDRILELADRITPATRCTR